VVILSDSDYSTKYFLKMLLQELAKILGCTLVGEPTLNITGIAPIEIARNGELTFLSNSKYKRFLPKTQAAAVILQNSDHLPAGLSALLSDNPYLTFALALEVFYQENPVKAEISPWAAISPSARLGNNISIGPFTVIDDQASIGDDVAISAHCVIGKEAIVGSKSIIHSHSVIRDGCRLGERVILQNHVIIGSDGFGYAQRGDKSWHKIRQLGTVVIEDNVEIGAGTTIDRAAIGITRIRRGTKIDNLVQVGHGSTVGQDTLLCAQVGLAGSTQIGNNVILAGQVGVAGHLSIGDGVTATAQTGIPNSVADGKQISGYPAIDTRDWRRAVTAFTQLPALVRELRKMKQQLSIIEARINTSVIKDPNLKIEDHEPQN
jgi:UDP-3-O-[3-hydroxymyristoyl] glucosamine N-acyltransferase